jgi:hypothetical protein
LLSANGTVPQGPYRFNVCTGETLVLLGEDTKVGDETDRAWGWYPGPVKPSPAISAFP